MRLVINGQPGRWGVLGMHGHSQLEQRAGHIAVFDLAIALDYSNYRGIIKELIGVYTRLSG